MMIHRSSYFFNLFHLNSLFTNQSIMFGFLFGWRKASNCKRLIRRIHCRLKLLNSKRSAIVRQVRDDVGQLLKVGHDQTVFTRVEQLCMDEILISVYELLGHFCDFITINLPYIRSQKDCPNDVKEAVSSLVFASARCGDVPELRTFRQLFEGWYGRRFVRTALELLPGNLVNSQIKEKLSITSVSEDAKIRVVNEIFRDYCLQSGSLAIQYSQEWHQKQARDGSKYDKPMQYVDENRGGETTKSALASNSVSDDCFSLQANPIGSHQKAILAAQDSVMLTEMDSLSSCSDLSVHLPDENLIYLDDVEELRSPKLYDCSSSPDKRLFMFKSSPLVDVQSGLNESLTRQRSSKSINRSRKFRKRSSSRVSVNLGQHVSNNGSSWELSAVSTKPLPQEKLSSEILEDVTEPFSAKRGRFQCEVSNGLSLRQETAKLRIQYPDRHDQRQRTHCCAYQPDQTAEQASGRSEVMEKGMIHNLRSPESSNGSNSVVSGSPSNCNALTFYVKDAETRYLRAFTMPAERLKDQKAEMYWRTSSLPVPGHVNHVHPKLPDYDQLEAKFSALKQDYLHSQCH